MDLARGTRGWLQLVAALLLAGCATTARPATTHVVRPGETVYRISRYYGVRVDDVVRANRIRDVSQLSIGTRLRIPGARRAAPSAPLPRKNAPAPSATARADAIREADLRFAWPLTGPLSSNYGWRRGRHHDGIDIPARSGAPVRAAEAGRVIHSGRGLGAYGRAVIVKHAGRYSSVYAHNSRTLVRRGEFVEKGEVICEVGATGRASGPHLHFEIRRNRKARNPLAYLP